MVREDLGLGRTLDINVCDDDEISRHRRVEMGDVLLIRLPENINMWTGTE